MATAQRLPGDVVRRAGEEGPHPAVSGRKQPPPVKCRGVPGGSGGKAGGAPSGAVPCRRALRSEPQPARAPEAVPRRHGAGGAGEGR